MGHHDDWPRTRQRNQTAPGVAFPHSLGLLYSAFTDYCGFRINSGEYKLMGLAPYGEPTLPTPSAAN
jgi:carbamoyltransferase